MRGDWKGVCTRLLTLDGGASISMVVYTIVLVRCRDGDSGVEERCTVFGSGRPGFDTQMHGLWCFYIIALRSRLVHRTHTESQLMHKLTYRRRAMLLVQPAVTQG